MSQQPILCSIEDGVATVTLNNAPLNVVTLAMTDMLAETLDRLAEDPQVRALILTGAGERAFCAGSDLSEFPSMMGPGEVLERKLRKENETYSKVDDFPKPTIAAISGLAYGGGLELAVCCDLLVVDDGAKLCLPEIKIGVFPGSGGSVRVTRRVGEGRAKEMMYFGEPVDAVTALGWGLVNRVVPRGQSLATAREMANRLAKGPGKALEYCKRAVDMSFDTNEDQAIADMLELIGEAFVTDDCREGVRAFFAKEQPRFTHR